MMSPRKANEVPAVILIAAPVCREAVANAPVNPDTCVGQFWSIATGSQQRCPSAPSYMQPIAVAWNRPFNASTMYLHLRHDEVPLLVIGAALLSSITPASR